MKIFKYLLVALLVLGILSRFSGLDQKVYTADEVRGILRSAGHTSEAFVQTTYTGEPIGASELMRFQTLTSDKGWGDTLQALAGNPEHPPLYYLLIRLVMQVANVPAAGRWLSAVFGVLSLPVLYFLVQELMQASIRSNAISDAVQLEAELSDTEKRLQATSRQQRSAWVGWVAIALFAISPFQVLLAYEARQYTLWGFLTLVASLYLLKALRQNRLQDWGLYALSAATGMYCHLFFTWVLVTHGLYVLITEKGRLTQKLLRYIAASVALSIAFLPWVWVVFSQMSRLSNTTDWVGSFKTGLTTRLGYWALNLSTSFIDFTEAATRLQPLAYIMVPIVALSAYGLWKLTPKRVWLFIFLLMGVTALAQIVPDVLHGGRRSLLSRYLMPSHLGLELLVAYGLACAAFPAMMGIYWPPLKTTTGKLAPRLVVAWVLVGSLVSTGLVSQSLVWGKGASTQNIQVAQVLNQQPTPPWIITDASHTLLLPLVHLISPEATFQLIERPEEGIADYNPIAQFEPEATPERFVYFPSPELLTYLQTRYGNRLENLVGDSKWFNDKPRLFRIKPASA
jgi:uncharacterized membrane protein